MLVVHVLGWCWLPCIQAYSLCSFHPMHLLHKHLRTCIIQDRKPRAQSSYPRSPRSSSRCSRRKWPKQTRRTLRNFQSAPITARAPSREASPRAFSPGLQFLIKYFTLIDALRLGVVCNHCCIIPCLPLLYYILVTLVSAVESMLSWLRPVEVGWFPVICEL